MFFNILKNQRKNYLFLSFFLSLSLSIFLKLLIFLNSDFLPLRTLREWEGDREEKDIFGAINLSGNILVYCRTKTKTAPEQKLCRSPIKFLNNRERSELRKWVAAAAVVVIVVDGK